MTVRSIESERRQSGPSLLIESTASMILENVYVVATQTMVLLLLVEQNSLTTLVTAPSILTYE